MHGHSGRDRREPLFSGGQTDENDAVARDGSLERAGERAQVADTRIFSPSVRL